MDLKEPISVENQVHRLISHKMDIANIDLAKRVLSEINYYRFTGYALQFRDEDNPDDYLSGTKFEVVWSLHQFDTEFRCILKRYLDIVELYARSQIAYGFSMVKCLLPPHDQHYESSNFFNTDSHDSIIVSSLDREIENNKDSLFVKHHEDKYGGRMPLWVIVELMSFTNLSKFFSAMYFSEQDVIAKNMGTTRLTLKNHLHCIANLRNKVAHAGRLYNVELNPPIMLGRIYLQRNPNVYANTLFAYLIAIMRKIPYKADKSVFAMEIINMITKYSEYLDLSLLGFPDDYIKLLCNEIK
jgi:abortive infection bacteriophage resistance protein